MCGFLLHLGNQAAIVSSLSLVSQSQHSHRPDSLSNAANVSYAVPRNAISCKTQASASFSPVTVAPRSTTDSECSASMAGVFDASLAWKLTLPYHGIMQNMIQ